MGEVTGYTAERMKAIEDASVIDGDIVAGHLILKRFDDSETDVGVINEVSMGLFADRPVASAENEGQLYFASDMDGGTVYLSDGANWFQPCPSVNSGGGGRETASVDIPQFTTAGNAIQDVTGATFGAVVPQSSLPQEIGLYIPLIRMNNWGSAVVIQVTLSIWTADNVTQLAAVSSLSVPKFYPKAATNPAAPENVGHANTIPMIPFPTLPRVRLAADAAASSYRLRITVAGLNAAGAAQTDMTVIIVNNGTTSVPFMNVMTKGV